MSVAWRLSEVEAAIPFEDVRDSWANRREAWLTKLFTHRHDARRLGQLMNSFLDALKPQSISMLWSHNIRKFAQLRESCQSVGSGEKASGDLSKELHLVLGQLEAVALPPTRESELRLLGRGRPDELSIGDDGPDIKIDEVCHVLDIRMVWCPATVTATRIVNEEGLDDGFVEYRVHYDGWNKKFDEWVRRDSGRVRASHSMTAEVGSPCVAFSAHRTEWTDAVIVAVRSKGRGREFKVHFQGSKASEDEWLDAIRVRFDEPPGSVEGDGDGDGDGDGEEEEEEGEEEGEEEEEGDEEGEPEHNQRGRGRPRGKLPPGWEVTRHVTESSGRHYVRYRGPDGKRASTVKRAWVVYNQRGGGSSDSGDGGARSPRGWGMNQPPGRPPKDKEWDGRMWVHKEAVEPNAGKRRQNPSAQKEENGVKGHVDEEDEEDEDEDRNDSDPRSKPTKAPRGRPRNGKSKDGLKLKHQVEDDEKGNDDDAGLEEPKKRQRSPSKPGGRAAGSSSSSSSSAPAPAETKAATASMSEIAEDPSDGRGFSSTVTEAALATPPESTTLLSEGDAIEEGAAVSALDVRRVWCDAHVVKLRWQKAKSTEPHVTAVKLRFEGWDPKWDEWVLLNSGKVRRKDERAAAKAAAKAAAAAEAEAQAKAEAEAAQAKAKAESEAAAAAAEAKAKAEVEAQETKRRRSSGGGSPRNGGGAGASGRKGSSSSSQRDSGGAQPGKDRAASEPEGGDEANEAGASEPKASSKRRASSSKVTATDEAHARSSKRPNAGQRRDSEGSASASRASSSRAALHDAEAEADEADLHASGGRSLPPKKRAGSCAQPEGEAGAAPAMAVAGAKQVKQARTGPIRKRPVEEAWSQFVSPPGLAAAETLAGIFGADEGDPNLGGRGIASLVRAAERDGAVVGAGVNGAFAPAAAGAALLTAAASSMASRHAILPRMAPQQTGTLRPAPAWSSHARPNLGSKLMSQPAALQPATPSGFSPPAAVKGATLSSLPSAMLHQLLKAMQLFREDAVVLAPNSFNPANMLIRLKLTASASVYVGAQIVSLLNDEVQVRGIEGAPTPIQRTKLQYVSNQPFSEMELAGLEFKLRNQIVKDVSLADAEQARLELVRIRLLLPPPPPKAR